MGEGNIHPNGAARNCKIEGAAQIGAMWLGVGVRIWPLSHILAPLPLWAPLPAGPPSLCTHTRPIPCLRPTFSCPPNPPCWPNFTSTEMDSLPLPTACLAQGRVLSQPRTSWTGTSTPCGLSATALGRGKWHAPAGFQIAPCFTRVSFFVNHLTFLGTMHSTTHDWTYCICFFPKINEYVNMYLFLFCSGRGGDSESS